MSAELKWEIREPEPRCDAPRGHTGKVRCEMRPDHVVGGRFAAAETQYQHTGRDAAGRWHSWSPTAEEWKRVRLGDAPNTA